MQKTADFRAVKNIVQSSCVELWILPMFPELKRGQQDYVIEKIVELYS